MKSAENPPHKVSKSVKHIINHKNRFHNSCKTSKSKTQQNRKQRKTSQTNNGEELTLESVSTLTSVVMFLFFNWVLTSATKSSPFLIPEEVIACSNIHKQRGFQNNKNHSHSHNHASTPTTLLATSEVPNTHTHTELNNNNPQHNIAITIINNAS